MGGFNMSGSAMNPQQTAANGVRATAGSSPSLGQMQQGMGGLITNDTQQNAFNSFLNGLNSQFHPMFNSMINSGYQGLGMEAPTQDHLAPQQPELSPYEKRLRVLMDTRDMTRDQAIANQAMASAQGTDYNNDGAVTDDEWRKFQQTPEGIAFMEKNQGPQVKQESLFELPERAQRAIANAKRLGGQLL